MLKKFRKDRDDTGFTMVEIMVVLIILAVLAAIAVPIYMRYVASARAAEAQEAIGAILASAKIYQADLGVAPRRISDLKLNLDPVTLERWNFTLTPGASGLKTVTATSTPAMKGGAGKVVTYDVERGEWTEDSYGQ